MTLSGLEAIVVGGGIGGLTAALCLARRGAQVRVLEQASELQEVGAGLQISPNGQRVISALGLSDAFRKVSVQAQAVQLVDYSGKPVVRLNLNATDEVGYHLVHRADLLNLLVETASKAGIEIKLGQTITQIVADEPGRVVTAEGVTETAPLIVAADGLHSVARLALNPETESFFTGQVAWRAVVPEDGATPDVRVFMGPRRHLVSYPLRDGRLRNIVAVQERLQWAKESWSQQDEPMNLRQVFADFCPEVTGLLSRVETVHLWGLFRHPVASRWHAGSVVLLGDAAHPTLPFLAQGANMALEDAWVLANELDGGRALSQGLAVYQARRRDRTLRIVDAASRNAWKYHLSSAMMRGAAHTALRLTGRIAPKLLLRQYDWVYHHDVTVDV